PEQRIPSITASSTGALEEAIAQLKLLGHTSIAFLGGPDHASTARERHSAFDSAMAANGLSINPALHFAGDFRAASGADGARWLLEHELQPTAVVI
ncbi:hypothetical protein BZG21_41465, partial [Escherichia coli]|nr:hypothetical protein [Escherichia coli]